MSKRITTAIAGTQRLSRLPRVRRPAVPDPNGNRRQRRAARATMKARKENDLMAHHGYSRLFGGDAAKQRAEIYAQDHGVNAKVFELGTRQAPFAAYGLDPWGRGADGIIYSYVAIDPPLSP